MSSFCVVCQIPNCLSGLVGLGKYLHALNMSVMAPPHLNLAKLKSGFLKHGLHTIDIV